MHFVQLGKIVACHGVRGYLRVVCEDALMADHVMNAGEIYLEAPGRAPARRVVRSARPHRGGLLIKLDGVDTRDAAQVLVGSHVSLPEEALPALADDEFYYSQIEGFRVQTTSGRKLGTICETFHNGSTDVWVVRDGEREYLIPVIADIVQSIDRSGQSVTIEPLEGLLDS